MHARSWLRVLLMAAGLVSFASAALSQQADAESQRIADQKAAMKEAKAAALGLLERMSTLLAEQESFGLKADISYDVVQPLGLRLEFGSESEVLLRRPDRLWVERRKREGETRTFYYDGSQVSLMFQQEAAYAQIEREGTVEQMLDYVVDELGMPMPLSDLFDRDFYPNVVDRIEFGAVVGESAIGGQPCTHAVYRLEEIDFQLWIAAEAPPLPCRIAITYRNRSGEPQFRARFFDWQLSAEAPDERFVFRPPDGAERIRVRAPAVSDAGGTK
jgi:hypothetical protein